MLELLDGLALGGLVLAGFHVPLELLQISYLVDEPVALRLEVLEESSIHGGAHSIHWE